MKVTTLTLLLGMTCLFPFSNQPAQASSEIPFACTGVQLLARGGGAGGGNGGLLAEVNQKGKLLQISEFLQSSIGRQAFPEIDPNAFGIVAKNVHFVFTEDTVYDNFGNERTCVWKTENCSVTCNRESFESETREKGADHVILAHEVFGLLGYERGDAQTPSPVHYSTRFFQWTEELERVNLGVNYVAGGKVYASIKRPYHLETSSTFSANQRDKEQFRPSLDGVCRYYGYHASVEASEVWRNVRKLKKDAQELGVDLNLHKWSIMSPDGGIDFQRDIPFGPGSASYLYEIVCWR